MQNRDLGSEADNGAVVKIMQAQGQRAV